MSHSKIFKPQTKMRIRNSTNTLIRARKTLKMTSHSPYTLPLSGPSPSENSNKPREQTATSGMIISSPVSTFTRSKFAAGKAQTPIIDSSLI